MLVHAGLCWFVCSLSNGEAQICYSLAKPTVAGETNCGC